MEQQKRQERKEQEPQHFLPRQPMNNNTQHRQSGPQPQPQPQSAPQQQSRQDFPSSQPQQDPLLQNQNPAQPGPQFQSRQQPQDFQQSGPQSQPGQTPTQPKQQSPPQSSQPQPQPQQNPAQPGPLFQSRQQPQDFQQSGPQSQPGQTPTQPSQQSPSQASQHNPQSQQPMQNQSTQQQNNNIPGSQPQLQQQDTLAQADGKKVSKLALAAILTSIILPPIGFALAIFAYYKISREPSAKGKVLSVIAFILSMISIFFYSHLFMYGTIPFISLNPYDCHGVDFPCHQENTVVTSTTKGTLMTEMTNNLEKDIILLNARVTHDLCPDIGGRSSVCIDRDKDDTCTSADDSLYGTSVKVGINESIDLIIDCYEGDQLEQDEVTEFLVSLDYYEAGRLKATKKTYEGVFINRVE